MQEIEATTKTSTPLVTLSANSGYRARTRYARMYLFSIKRRKFIKFKRDGYPINCWDKYCLFPGRYLALSWVWRKKDNPKGEIILEVIKVLPTGTWETIKFTEIPIYSDDYLLELPSIVQDFYKMRPLSYHTCANIDTNKIYSKEEVNELIDFINKNNIEVIQ